MMNKLVSSVIRIWTDMVVIIEPILCRRVYGVSSIIAGICAKFSIFTNSLVIAGMHIPVSLEETKGVITYEA